MGRPKEDAGVAIAKHSKTMGVVIVKDNRESRLLRLPNEIKQKIWILAVSESEPITPIQLKDKSNKFLWSQSQVNEKYEKAISAVPQLAVVQLSKVCRTLYEEVALTHLFYRSNDFDLSSSNYVLAITYLVAITEARMNAIRSIKISLEFGRWANHNAKLFTLLQACDGLQMLEMKVDWQINRYSTIGLESLRGLRELVAALQGPKKFKFTTTDPSALYGNQNWAKQVWEKTKAICVEAETYIKEQLEAGEGIAIKISTLRKAQEMANLNVYGEGRLGQDKKPGVIASRTRQKAHESLNPDGTFAKKLAPKYDAEGEIAWYVSKILGSREVEEEDGTPTVEFWVKCEPSTHDQWWTNSGLPGATTSWETVAALGSSQAREAIVLFYDKDPKADGIRLVVDAWEHRGANNCCRKSLLRIIRIQDAREVREATKAAAKVAKVKTTTEKKRKKVTKVSKSDSNH